MKLSIEALAIMGRVLFVLLGLTDFAAATPRSLVEMTGFSFYLGCNPSTPTCWVTMTPGPFYNILNIGVNPKPLIIRDDLAEMNIITGGFTPQASGVYKVQMLMEGVSGSVVGGHFVPSSVMQTLMSCGWSTTPETFPDYAIVMIEQQGAGFFNNSHMTPLIMPLVGGVTYFMTCWASSNWVFNNLTVQRVGFSPIPVVDFIINRID